MNIVFDIIFTLFLLFGLCFGWKKGMVAFLEKPIRFFGALTFAAIYGSSLSTGILRMALYPSFYRKVSSILSSGDDGDKNFFYLLVKQLMNNFSVSANANNADNVLLEKLLTDKITDKVSYALSLLFLFIVGYLFLWAVLSFAKAMTKDGLVGTLNHVCGLFIGGVLFFLLSCGCVRFFEYGIVHVLGIGTKASAELRNSYLYSLLNHFHPLDFFKFIYERINK